MRALVLDGPIRGQLITLENHKTGFDWPVLSDLPIAEVWSSIPSPYPNYETLTYRIEHFKFGKYRITVATSSETDPSEDDAFDLIVSEKAKQASC